MNRFRFKQFRVQHHRSSMKVGTDAIVIGAWASTDQAQVRRILDVGTGCGVIGLMMAQRFPDTQVDAIDLDGESVAEAKLNFEDSPWNERLQAYQTSLQDHSTEQRYDIIVSNPPWFQTGPQSPCQQRRQARHQKTLTPESFVKHAVRLINDGGRITIVVPVECADSYCAAFQSHDFGWERRCDVIPRPGRLPLRSLLQFSLQPTCQQRTSLTLEIERHVYSPDYIGLAHAFLLRMPTPPLLAELKERTDR